MKKNPVFVAMCNQKGGVGKSAMTILLAGYYHYLKGLNVAVVDCDYPQYSLIRLKERDMRTVENLNNHPIRLAQRPEGKRTYRGGIGNRGRIAARNWFEPLATKELNNAAEQFDLLLDALIKKEFS